VRERTELWASVREGTELWASMREGLRGYRVTLRPWELAVPLPELVLEVGHVGLVRSGS
jgi:hypothetical protein